MKKLYLIGNMKMNMNFAILEPYFEKLHTIASQTQNVVGVCVPFVYLDMAKGMLDGSRVLVGAQNMHFEKSGAFTGEISADMLNDIGCDMVIIGHSERRAYFHETDEDVALKVQKALEEGLTPILCFGETLDERNGNTAYSVVERQLMTALEGLDEEEIGRIIFAYEPVWAIGTGVSATSDQAEDMISFAKRLIEEQFGVKDIVVLYGGSLKPSNAQELLSKPSIDGGLIGGACLNIKDFEELIMTKVE